MAAQAQYHTSLSASRPLHVLKPEGNIQKRSGKVALNEHWKVPDQIHRGSCSV